MKKPTFYGFCCIGFEQRPAFQNLLPTLLTMQLTVTGDNLSDHMKLPVEPHEAFCYFCSHMQSDSTRPENTLCF